MASSRSSRWRIPAALMLWALLSFLPLTSGAYPDAEVIWDAGGGPPFNVGISAVLSGIIPSSDDQMILSDGQSVELVDLGAYAPEPAQPVQPDVDDGTDGTITGIAYINGNGMLLASQADGDLVIWSLGSLDQKPISYALATGDELGAVVADKNGRYAYVADNTTMSILVFNLATLVLDMTVPLTISGVPAFTITDGVFNDTTGEAYFTTDKGALFVLPSGGGTAAMIDIGVSVTPPPTALSLPAVAAMPTGDQLFVVDATTPALWVVSAQTHAIVGAAIDISQNPEPSDIAITGVNNPSGTYAYVAGSKGLTVVDAVSLKVFDYGTDPAIEGEPMPISAEPLWVVASSKDDGIVYLILSTSELALVTENPLAAITGVVYSGGGSSLGLHQSVAVTFMADTDGTYELRSGGTVTANGTLLTDSAGAVSGSVVADTATTVTINYDDNAAAFAEGTNDLWVFVTSAGLRGRRSTSISVDTPPPAPVITSTGFGNTRVYVNFERLTVEDMATYRVYLDADPDAVLTKADPSATVAQSASGSSLTAQIDGLTNGTTYYVAMDAVDAGGNVSLTRTATLPDGSRVSQRPEATVGPAGLAGEKGCAMVPGGARIPSPIAFFLIGSLAVIAGVRLRPLRRLLPVLLIAAALLAPAVAAAEAPSGVVEGPAAPVSVSDMIKTRPPMWALEVKTGFWMPSSDVLQQFYSPCCNMVTRIQGGLVFQQRYGVELGAGFFYGSGSAKGVDSGQPSQDRFSLLLIPIETSFVWRADYFSWRYLIPYAKLGFDSWVYRESDPGSTITGVKFGGHGVAGFQLNISEIAGTDIGENIDEFFMTFEAQYQWISNFGQKGLNLSGPIFSVGFLARF